MEKDNQNIYILNVIHVHAMKAYVRVEILLHSDFGTRGDEWSFLTWIDCPHEKRPTIPLNRRPGGSRAGLVSLEKRKTSFSYQESNRSFLLSCPSTSYSSSYATPTLIPDHNILFM